MLKSLNVLYIEKDEYTREYISDALEFMSMNVTSTNCGDEAYSLYLKNRPDILVSDIHVPILNKCNLVEKIRQNDNNIQIIITSDITSTEHFLKAVELNLVKYLLKPISLNHLKNALTICVNNIENKWQESIKYFNKYDFYNLSDKLLMVDNKTIKLDYHERGFLELLLKHNDRTVTYSEIEKEIWDNNMSSAAIRSLVRNLRKKLPENCIENLSKIGYKINLNNQQTPST